MRKCRETPWKLLFVLASFGGSYSQKKIFISRQPNHVKYLLSGLYNLLKYNFHSLRSPPVDPRVAHCSHFRSEFYPPISLFFPLTGISARGPQGRSDTALRPNSIFLAPYQALFPAICLISEGKITKKSILLCPPSLIQRQITTHPVALLEKVTTNRSERHHQKNVTVKPVLLRLRYY
jgi:hypothetical protein